MKGLLRNQRTFWLLPYQDEETIFDEYGNESGTRIRYGFATEYMANISPATGYAQTEMFGNLADYDKVISPLPADFPITESDVLFVDKAPEYRDEDGQPVYDYTVRRIARSLNSTAVAIRKVTVS